MEETQPKRSWSQWSLETALAGLLSLAVYWLWPRLELPLLGHEQIWFALGWLLILALPSLLHLAPPRGPGAEPLQTLKAQACGHASFMAAGLFLLLLAAGKFLGNYKLWLGIIYLGGATARLAGLSLNLRSFMLAHPQRELTAALAGGGIASLACLAIVPWALPSLVALWPPPPGALLHPLAAALIWGGITGAALLACRQLGWSRRLSWLVCLAVGMGPGPALAVVWFGLWPMLISFLILAGLTGMKMLYQPAEPAPSRQDNRPLSLYWLLRALMLLWWGCGITLVLASAWWQPAMGDFFTHSIWLRAVGLGTLLVICVGVLSEYSLPLLGRSGWISLGLERKVIGVLLSALALLAAFSPLVLPSKAIKSSAQEFFQRSRAELVKSPLTLDQELPQIELAPPSWLQDVTHVFVVGYLEDGAHIPQGQTVAMLVATDELDMPHVFNLRAGIDTADSGLAQKKIQRLALHQPAQIASTSIAYSPAGEAYPDRTYYSGLYLGRKVEKVKNVRIRLIYQPPDGEPAPLFTLTRVFIY